MSRSISFAPGEFYHLYNRGTEKRNIFSGRNDYERFLSLLYLSNSTERVHIENHQQSKRGSTLLELLAEPRPGKPLVAIGAYCLMPNHFHFLVHEIEKGGISRFMQKLTTGYTMYFNVRYERTGALFQGKFKATHASEDQHLKYLMAYIHLNPIKLIDPKWRESGIKNQSQARKYLEEYQYSSYLDYLGEKRIQNVIVRGNALPKYFDSPKNFKEHVTDWLNYKT
jgi:putative transposase